MRLATRTPVRCSSCFGQKPASAHVDFESSYDGPPIDTSNPRSPHVDWVVICDECIQSAHALLPEVREVVDSLREQLHAAQAELADVGAYADKLESAIVGRPERKSSTPAEPKPPRKPRYQTQKGS